MIEFKIKDHQVRPAVKILEIWADGKFKAAIYPQEEDDLGVSLITGHARLISYGIEGNLRTVRVAFTED